MNKTIRALCALAFALTCAYGQSINKSYNNISLTGTTQLPYVTTAPSGACTVINAIQVYVNGTGQLVDYGCTPPSGQTTCSPSACTWVAKTSGGSGGFAGGANLVVASPNGSSGTAGLRALVSNDLPSIIAASTTGEAARAAQLTTTPSLCSTGQAPTGILANGNATGCAAIGSGGGGTGNANSFAITKTSTTATVTCPVGSTCSVQQGDSPYTYSGYSGSFTAAGGSYTAYFCLNGDTMELSYNGTTITTYSGVTLIPGATSCQDERLLIATAAVSGTTVSSVTLIDPHYIQPMKYIFPGQTVTSNGKVSTVVIAGGGGTGVSQACYRANYNQASLAAGTTRVSVSTGLALPANTVVLGTWIKTNTAFAGVSGVGVSIGDSGSDTVFGNIFNLNASVANTNIQVEPGFGAYTAATDTVLLIFTGAANLSGLTAGQVDACLMYQTLTAESSPTVL